jgi:hypothetical protein
MLRLIVGQQQLKMIVPIVLTILALSIYRSSPYQQALKCFAVSDGDANVARQLCVHDESTRSERPAADVASAVCCCIIIRLAEMNAPPSGTVARKTSAL